jgi:hypothetical protein
MSYLDKSAVIHEENSPDYEDAESQAESESQNKFFYNLNRPEESNHNSQTKGSHF